MGESSRAIFIPRKCLIELQLPKKRTVDEYVGKIHISDDFDAPLFDEFWFGEYVHDKVNS